MISIFISKQLYLSTNREWLFEVCCLLVFFRWCVCSDLVRWSCAIVRDFLSRVLTSYINVASLEFILLLARPPTQKAIKQKSAKALPEEVGHAVGALRELRDHDTPGITAGVLLSARIFA